MLDVTTKPVSLYGRSTRRFLPAACAGLLVLAAGGCRETDSGIALRERTDVAPAKGAPHASLVSPYGICEGVARLWMPRDLAERELALLEKGGIGWVRCDFDWGEIQPKREEWRFAHIDDAVQRAEDHHVQILPILDYSAPWATPAWKHMEDWLVYVRTTVARYRGRIRFWEVWNEANLDVQGRNMPDPKVYAAFLCATYREIKAVDPEASVLVGGLSQIPLDYLEGFYQAGGKNGYDIMNVHPYRDASPEGGALYDDLRRLTAVMQRHGDGGKPVWITEIGYATPRVQNLSAGVLQAGMRVFRPAGTRWHAAVLSDNACPDCPDLADADYRQLVGEGCDFRRIGVSEIATLKRSDCDLLVMHPSEAFPAGAFDAMNAFVEAGGVIFLWSGVPLYYELVKTNGVWRRNSAQGGKATAGYRKRLRIGWEASWTRAGVPRQARNLSVGAQFSDLITIDPADKTLQASSFLTPGGLEQGDVFIPLVTASNGVYQGAVAAVYKRATGGGVIVSMFHPFAVDELMQARYLARTALVAFQAGVEKFFWYNFRAPERDAFDRERHYGIVHRDLSPKPGWHAYTNLVQLRPAGSVTVGGEWCFNGVYRVAWRRPDGLMGWALWTRQNEGQAVIRVTGMVRTCVDALGRDSAAALVPSTNGSFRVNLANAPLYLIGPFDITVSN